MKAKQTGKRVEIKIYISIIKYIYKAYTYEHETY